MKVYLKFRYGIAMLLLVLAAICTPYLDNPLFFDDLNFFSLGGPAAFLLADGDSFAPRWWVHEMLALVYVYFNADVFWLRLGNLLLHFSVAAALAYFTREILRDIDRLIVSPVSADAAAFLVALLFLVHPLAIFTQGYLIQATIICATLFFLLSMLAFWRALSGSLLGLFGFCVFAVLSMYAKEHAVMLPAAAFLVLIFRWRSGLLLGLPLSQIFTALLFVGSCSLLVVFYKAGYIGVAYEPQVAELLKGGEINYLYFKSVLSQAGLFFKYITLWAFVLPGSISVDIKQEFPTDLVSWQLWLGAVAYVSYFFFAVFLLWRGGVKGLFGLGLIVPAVMFFTEFSTVRLQESFVIYRSYLWVPFMFIALAVALRRVALRAALSLVVLFFIFFTGLSILRLNTFSSPVFIWLEAASVYEDDFKGVDVLPAYRIYYNLGTQLKLIGASEASLNAFNRALELKPDDGFVLNNRGAVHVQMENFTAAQQDYERAVQLMPNKYEAWNGLANSLKSQGRFAEAAKAWQVSCALRGISPCPQI